MKHDLFAWQEVKTNEKIEVQKGTLRLRLSAPAPVYAEAEGVETLIGTKANYEVALSEPVSLTIAAAKGVRAFIYVPPATSCAPVGEVFTNIDRMPHESGMLADVTRARRQLELERRAMLAEIRAENARLRSSIRRDNEAVRQDDPEPVPEPENEGGEE